MKQLLSRLNVCGCTDFTDIEKDIILLLKHFNRDLGNHDLTTILNKVGGTSFYLLGHFLTHVDLVEHGTSIRYSWLTPKGKEFLKNYK